MDNIMDTINRLINDESGATAIEYGLIAGLVAVAIIAALSALGTSLTSLFTSVSDELDGAVGS
jgi:pilus assembly protein Flp/PilA